ncbi:MAG: DUF4430 domain-containing protein [Suipraeoptans sp.]
MEKKTQKRLIIGFVVFVIAIAAMLVFYMSTKPEVQEGKKEVTIVVVSIDEKEKEYKVETSAEYLKQVMDEAEGLTYSGQEGNPGMIVDTINGEVASYEENSAYWAFYVNGEYCNYGIEEQSVKEGDEFKIVYTTDQ